MTGTMTGLHSLPHAATEMNHRIANNLTLLASLIECDSRQVIDPQAIVVLDAARRRIHAIANVHRRLYKIEAVDRLDLLDFVEDLARDLRGVCEGAGRARHLTVDGDSILVSADQALAIGILVAELVTNACKHAYPASTGGEIRITLSNSGDAHWILAVEDDGCGYTPSPMNSARGLGSRIIDASVDRLGASCTWEDNRPGTRFVMHYGPTTPIFSPPSDIAGIHPC